MTPLSQCKNRQLLTMEKRRKKHHAVLYGMDRFPDEILIVILSCLTLKEVVRTSVISRRWRYLWRYTSGSIDLDFDHWVGIRCWAKAPDFVRWVDQVVKLHQGPSIEKFSFDCLRLGGDYADSVSNWIHFAMQKDVTVFELGISDHNFPDLDKFLSISSAIKYKHRGFSSLTSFKLVEVSIKDEMIEYLLSNCPRLEHLSLMYQRHLKNPNIVGPSLKSLVVHFCAKLETLTISAANLVSFEFGESTEKPASDLQFQNVPLLSELKLYGSLYCPVFYWVQRHSKYSHLNHQLERLHLDVRVTNIPSLPVYAPTFKRLPQMQCLKQLDLVLETFAGESLLFFVFWIMACPFLSRVDVTLSYFSPACEEKMLYDLHSFKGAQEDLTSYHHQHLKVVRLINFACFKSDFRFALALLQIAKSLEKMIIKPGPGRFLIDLSPTVRKFRFLTVRERAKQLEANLPRGAELVIL